jgi:hypothetical protein
MWATVGTVKPETVIFHGRADDVVLFWSFHRLDDV